MFCMVLLMFFLAGDLQLMTMGNYPFAGLCGLSCAC